MAQTKDLLASGGGPSSDLVEGRVANLIDAYLRSALNHFPQGLQHSWIDIAAIGVGILFLIPQTDSDGFGAPRDDECYFVLEAFCFRSSGRVSCSISRVNSATLFGFRWTEILRANMSTSSVVVVG